MSTLKAIPVALFLILLLFVISLGVEYSQLSRYQKYWTHKNTADKTPGAVEYIALGDSTAQGIGATNPENGYVGVISRELAQRKNKPVHTINLSKSGAKVDDVLQTQLPKLKELSPSKDTIITIEIGANNMINFDAKSFESSMDKVMTQLPPQTLITDIPYFGGSRFKSREPNVEQANNIMYRLAAKHNFTLVPLHQKLQDNSGIETFAPDWFHPSNVAYRDNWAYVFLQRL